MTDLKNKTESTKNITFAVKPNINMQTYFDTLLNGLSTLATNEANDRKILESLCNLLEQAETIQKLDTSEILICSQFPDLQAAMLVKISHEVDLKVESLSANLKFMKEQHDLLHKAIRDIIKVYKKMKPRPSPEMMVKSTPCIPPQEMLIKWLDALEKQYREIIFSRQFYLENLNDKISSDNLLNLWFAGSKQLMGTLQDCQEQQEFFLKMNKV